MRTDAGSDREPRCAATCTRGQRDYQDKRNAPYLLETVHVVFQGQVSGKSTAPCAQKDENDGERYLMLAK